MYRHSNLKKIILIISVLLLLNSTWAGQDSLTIVSPNYFGEEKNIYDAIHYLENELLSFKFCTETTARNIDFKINCKNFNENLFTYKIYNNQGCYFTNYNLSDIPCSDFDLEISYDVNNKNRIIKRSFTKQKESLLINHILGKDYNVLNDLEASYYLIVLNDIQDKDYTLNTNVYEKLKNDRDNSLKCWPSNSCDIGMTSEILRNLWLATYSLDTRILEDGKIYLERNYIDDPLSTGGIITDADESVDYEFELNFYDDFVDDVECESEVDGDEDSYDFDSGSDFDDKRIEDNVEDDLYVECDANVEKITLDVYKEKLYDKTYEDVDEFDYDISSSDFEEYNDFSFKIQIIHEFDVDEEIECTLGIDDKDSEEYIFNEDTDDDDLFIRENFDNNMIFECEDDIDTIKFDVYAEMQNELTFENTDDVDYSVSSSNEESFDFEIEIVYDFDSNEEIACELAYDDVSKNYVFDDNDELIIENKRVVDSISFSCDVELKNIYFKLYDNFGRKQVDEEYKDDDSFSYSVVSDFSKYICVGKNSNCEYNDNLNALEVYDSELEERTALQKYIDSYVIKGENEEYYVYDSNAIIDTGKFLFGEISHSEEESLVNYLKFKQNNDGSWGDNVEKILYTVWAVLGLQKGDSNAEHVVDGEKWIYYNEPNNGWGSVEKNALAYYAIKEQLKPYLRITAKNEMIGVNTFKIENPTIYNLKDIKISFSNEINDYISYNENLGDLEGEDYILFNVSIEENFLGTKSGELIITGIDGKKNKLNLIKIPINIKGKTAFKITSQNYAISADNNLIKIYKSNIINTYNYVCSYTNPFSSKSGTINISDSTPTIDIANNEKLTGTFNFNLDCKSDNDIFMVPVTLHITNVNSTFSVNQTALVIESLKSFEININNLNNNQESINIEIIGDYNGLIEPVDKNIALTAYEEKEISFSIVNPELLKEIALGAQGSIVIKDSKGYQKEIPVMVILNDAQEEGGFNWLIYVLIIIVILFVVGIILWRKSVLLKQQQQREAENQHAQEEEFDLDEEFEY